MTKVISITLLRPEERLYESHILDFEEDLHTSYNRLYICPNCGEPWAKMQFGEGRQWRTLMRSCSPSHIYFASEHSGSLFDNWREDIFLLPPKALFREVLLILNLSNLCKTSLK